MNSDSTGLNFFASGICQENQFEDFKMRVLYISSSISSKAGGIFEIMLGLAANLNSRGIHLEVQGLEDANWNNDKARWQMVPAKAHRIIGPPLFGYSPEMMREVMNPKFDMVHLHTMWMYPSIVAHHWQKTMMRPLIVTPNGMLEPWALVNSAAKKKIAGMAYENRMLKGAACLHANTNKELSDIRTYGLKNPIAVIPNGVELVDAETLKTETLKSEHKILLFLGRIHPKKGLVNALRAWANIRGQESVVRGQENEWQFVIAGWDQGGHEAELKRLCTELGLAYADVPSSVVTTNRQQPTANSSTVIFTGPAFGEQKDALLRSASAFILPSFSEGLPMSVLEAWSYQLPVLMTDHCNLPEGFAADAAIRIGTDTASIAEGMRQLFSFPTTDNGQTCHGVASEAGQTTSLASLGNNGRQLVSERFTWPQVAAQMKEVYEWVLGGGEAPDCVRQF